MAKPRPGPRYGQISYDEARLFLPDCPVVEARWVLPGAAFTEIKPARWAHIHVLGLLGSHGLELAGPGAAEAGWGLRSFDPQRGWIYFETRRAHRKDKRSEQ